VNRVLEAETGSTLSAHLKKRGEWKNSNKHLEGSWAKNLEQQGMNEKENKAAFKI
jgi:hypothetical protein